MFKFITAKPLWANILAGIVILMVLIVSFFFLLDWMTGHNQYEKVPSVVSQNIDAARINLAAKGFAVEIADSVYENSIGALSVVKQSPEADALVKSGRTIYLTINRAVPPQVAMPNLVGFSSRSAEMYLTSLGLKLGDTYYRADIARNAVLEQRYNDEVIKEGTKIPLGSIINLVLGTGEGSGELFVPNLVGLTLAQARSQLATLGLNIGSVIPVEAVKDSSNAFIVRQNPEVSIEPEPGQKIINKLRAGQLIDVYISSTAPIKDSIISH